jgi:hypothetical protein
LQCPLLELDVAEIVVHEADAEDTLTGERLDNLLAADADATAGGHDDVAIIGGIAVIRGPTIGVGGTLPRVFERSFPLQPSNEVIPLFLLLQSCLLLATCGLASTSDRFRTRTPRTSLLIQGLLNLRK